VDFGVGTPEPQQATSSDEHGRGLLLIDALTAAWGIEDGPGSGKLVWAELSLPSDVDERQSS
jgi:hypothetical protein